MGTSDALIFFFISWPPNKPKKLPHTQLRAGSRVKLPKAYYYVFSTNTSPSLFFTLWSAYLGISGISQLWIFVPKLVRTPTRIHNKKAFNRDGESFWFLWAFSCKVFNFLDKISHVFPHFIPCVDASLLFFVAHSLTSFPGSYVPILSKIALRPPQNGEKCGISPGDKPSSTSEFEQEFRVQIFVPKVTRKPPL